MMADYDESNRGYGVNKLNVDPRGISGDVLRVSDEPRGLRQQLDHLNGELMKLSEVVAMFMDRLEPGLRPPEDNAPSKGLDEKDDRSCRSQLGDMINDNTDTVKSIQRRLNLIMPRVDF